MNKTLSIITIALLSVFIAFLSYILFTDSNFFTKNGKTVLLHNESYEVANIDLIRINAKSYDVEIIDDDIDKIKVVVNGKEKDVVTVNSNDNELDINVKQKTTICFFCINSKTSIKVYVPSNYAGKFDIDLKSGDTTISDLKFANLRLRATSGDLLIKSIKDADIKLTSGDIEIDEIDNLDAITTSGDLEIRQINSLDLVLRSGDVEIDSLNSDCNIVVTSGDIDIDKFNILSDSNIKTTSGDVKIKNIDNVFVDASVKSGDINVHGSDRNADYELKIKTTSGDIKVN